MENEFTQIENNLLDALETIDSDDDFLLGVLAFSKTDECKNRIIQGIKDGTLKTTDDVFELI